MTSAAKGVRQDRENVREVRDETNYAASHFIKVMYRSFTIFGGSIRNFCHNNSALIELDFQLKFNICSCRDHIDLISLNQFRGADLFFTPWW